MKRVVEVYKGAFTGLSPATWWLSLVMLINRSGTMVIPFMTLYLVQTKNYPIGKTGMVMACFGLGAICGGMLGGKLTDKLGFYTIQLFSLISGGVMFIVLGQLESFAAILICSFILALLNDTFRPANATAVAHYSKEENITRSFSLNRLSINLGWAVGGALGGFIASHNYHLLFWIDGCTNIGAALLLRAVLSPSKNNLTPPNKDFRTKTITHSAYKDGPYLLFIAMTVLFGMMFFQIFSTLPVYFTQVLHMTPFYVGLVMAINGMLIALFEMAIVYRLGQNKNTIQYIGIGVILIGISYIVFNILPGELSLAIFSTVIITFGEMLSMPFMNTYWVSRTNKDNRGQYAGLYTVAWSIAQVVGPYSGSQLAEKAGFTALWWTMGGISVVAALGFLSLSKANK